jgi:predicted kinase
MLLTGGPASGKSATAAELAKTLPRVAVNDVDDIRHLVVAGHAAPCEGDDGVLQQRIGVWRIRLISLAASSAPGSRSSWPTY